MSVAWPPDRRAESLVPQRASLVRRLPYVVPAAHALTADDRELVVDDALAYVVLEYQSPIASAREAEEVFWTAARIRAARVLEGRNATVRGGFGRTSEAALGRIAAEGDDPAELAERSVELDLAAEFAASLGTLEGQVLRIKWLSDDGGALGYRKVAAKLDISPARARSAERSIAGKIERFATMLTGGRLCAERSQDLAALVSDADDATAVGTAKAHIKHCTACKTDYVAQVRALRSAAFQRDVASVIPVAPLEEAARRHGGAARDLAADWLGRLGGSDAVPATAQSAASGVGRGAGGVLAVKIAAVLAAGATTVGVTTNIFDSPRRESPPRTVQKPKPTPTVTPTPEPTPDVKSAIAAAERSYKRRQERRDRRERRADAPTQGGTSPTSQEQAPASAAPPDSLPDGGSEFSVDSADSQPAAPAPVPAAPGASEFP